MQVLTGIHHSTILDETYNAGPAAMMGALETLYAIQAPQKIALLGNMNELGKYTQEAHEEVGAYCDPAQLDIVLTLGQDANDFLAVAAETKGCKVKRCTTPYEAGEYLREAIKEGGIILVKGSQNNVYAEEAVKMLLANPEDSKLLVRQSTHWQKVKQRAWSGQRV
jgi:UDP-N-acetylmuramoyl-tripeptide--D-alanyl-D-alanine ligase